MNGLGTIADIIILNIVHLICCIPIVTIGAATTSLYTVTMKMARKEYPAVLKSYFKAFKQNFKVSTLSWLIVAAAGTLLWLDFRIVALFQGGLQTAARIALGAAGILYLLIVTYLFPYIARFENTVKNSLRNALILSVAHFPFTVILAGLPVGLIILALMTTKTFMIAIIVGFFFGFALLAYIQSLLFAKIFEKYE